MFIQTTNGKLIAPAYIGATAGDRFKPKRLTIIDRKTKIPFLVDTGADASILPRRCVTKHSNKTDKVLYAANQSSIKTYGEVNMTLDLGLRRPYTGTFIVADVHQAILGNDFLYEHHLLPDIRNRRLLDNTTKLYADGLQTVEAPPSITVIAKDADFNGLLEKYIIEQKTKLPTQEKNLIEHHIVTKGPPCTDRARRLPPEKYRIAKQQIEAMIAEGILKPSDSPYSSAILLRPKADGNFRLCGDYRQLNKSTKRDKYPVPHIQSFSHQLYGCTIFSKINIERAFHNIRMAPEDQMKTAIITPFGLFEYKRMPFGLANRQHF